MFYFYVKKEFFPSYKITIEILTEDMDFREFSMRHEGIVFCIQRYIKIEENILYLISIDIEGPGSTYYNTKLFRLINEVGEEFCKLYQKNVSFLKEAKEPQENTKANTRNQ